ncbi:hypothetical protein HK097_007726 [Rhizophlyctis rosea]|uniref:NAD(P)-binding domain-containing protein n=1 Tax=Rhizophlyctis rosea TaxID=64517 RepID=A0AAD5SED6_9FUNG|nr:hypothetical protein HK097_007726 [Rhizophlyctis rosea]
MKITVLGATGETGREVVRLAIAAEHTVTALVHDAAKAPFHSQRLFIVEGDAFNLEDVKKAVKDADAVVIALGARGNSPSTSTVQRGTKTVLEALKSLQKLTCRVIVITSSNGDKPPAGSSIFRRLLYAAQLFVLDHAFADHAEAERLLEAEDWVQYTILRPLRLLPAPQTGFILHSSPAPPSPYLPITHTDLAAAIVDVLDHPKPRQSIGVSSISTPHAPFWKTYKRVFALIWENVKNKILLAPVHFVKSVVGGGGGQVQLT